MRKPGDTDRLAIFGATGSGKTHSALWNLSQRNYDEKPWIVFDYKIDELINSIDGATHLTLDSPIPRHPGIYIVHPTPDEELEVSEFMLRIWAQEDTGVYIDEGFMVGNNSKGFRLLLTQGRSKHIPMIICSQRPVWIDRFVLSESTFIQMFRLQHRKDVATVEQFVPFDLEKRLPRHYSYFYDVADNHIVIMRPAPDSAAIMDTFNSRIRRLRKVV